MLCLELSDTLKLHNYFEFKAVNTSGSDEVSIIGGRPVRNHGTLYQTCFPADLPALQPTYLLTCQPACMDRCVPPICLATNRPANLPPCHLPTHLHTCKPLMLLLLQPMPIIVDYHLTMTLPCSSNANDLRKLRAMRICSHPNETSVVQLHDCIYGFMFIYFKEF